MHPTPRPTTSTVVPLLAALASFVTAGCGGTGEDGSEGGATRDGGIGGTRDERRDRIELSVFAAASLTEAFAELAAAFEAAHPDVEVRSTFAGSQVLRLQIEQGAAADVFASANEEHARALNEAGFADDPATLAWSRLVVVVPDGDPAGIGSFEGLDRAERLVLGTPAVPAGRYARELLDRAEERYGAAWADRVRAAVASEESSVRLARAKVELGEADAAFVYRTDALASGRVRMIEPPEELAVRARYLIARVRADGGSARATGTPVDAARRFIDFALGNDGQAILARHGFDVVGGAP